MRHLALLLAVSACGTTVSPTDGATPSDVELVDASTADDVRVRPPTSLIRVTRQNATSSFAGGTEVGMRLFPPVEEGSDVEDNVMGECFYRRAPSQRNYTDGVATWRVGDAQGQLRPLTDRGPLVFDNILPPPQPSAVVEVALTGSAFPSFVARASLPLPIVVTQPAMTDTSVSMPREGQSLTVRWNVPAIPASAIVRAYWEGAVKNVYCIVPATRGEYTFPLPVMEMFRSAGDARLVITHANTQYFLAGDRPVRYIVEYQARVVEITP